MIIEFLDDRDLLDFGKVKRGVIRDDLPPEFAALQVEYGHATEVVADNGGEE